MENLIIGMQVESMSNTPKFQIENSYGKFNVCGSWKQNAGLFEKSKGYTLIAVNYYCSVCGSMVDSIEQKHNHYVSTYTFDRTKR